MARTPFLGPFNVSRSKNFADNQLINLYPEFTQTRDAKDAAVLLGTPGLDLLATVGSGPIRGVHIMGGIAYVVSGVEVYSVTPAWVQTLLGNTGLGGDGSGAAPVSMIDNGTQLLFVDGEAGYLIQSGVMTTVSFPFTLPTYLAYQDGVGVCLQGQTQTIWQSNIGDLSTWDATNFAFANTQPGDVLAIASIHDELVVLKQFDIEFWTNAGLNGFLFQRLPQAHLEVGIWAPFSLARAGERLLFLGQSKEGTNRVIELSGYNPRPVSDHALEFQLAQLANTADGIGYSYQQEGHVFYVLNLPSGNQTWSFDATDSEVSRMPVWHRRCSFGTTDPSQSGLLNRHFGNAYARFAGFSSNTYIGGSGSPFVLTPTDYDTLNPCDATVNATLAQGNLQILQNTNIAGDDGAARGIVSHTSGKYYFELNPLEIHSPGGSHMAIGIAPGSATLSSAGAQAAGAVLVCGTLFAIGPPVKLYGSIVVGGTTELSDSEDVDFEFNPFNTIFVAVDLDNKAIWFRSSTGSTWNGSGTADPATNTGGFSIAGLTGPFFPFVAMTVDTGEKALLNFGASAFAGTVPDGFTAGWTFAGGGVGPGVPTSFSSPSQTSTSISLSWSAGSGGSPLSYTLQYRPLNTTPWTIITGILTTSETINDLIPGTTYEFQVQANLLGGPCPFTGRIRVQTAVQRAVVSGLGAGIVGDYRNGNLYAFDLDTLDDAGSPRKWVRSWRAMPKPTTEPTSFNRLQIDMETGFPQSEDDDPQLMLRYSDDGGHTWSQPKVRPAGKTGQVSKRVHFDRLGSTRQRSGLDRIFELSSADPFKTALIGADLEIG